MSYLPISARLLLPLLRMASRPFNSSTLRVLENRREESKSNQEIWKRIDVPQGLYDILGVRAALHIVTGLYAIGFIVQESRGTPSVHATCHQRNPTTFNNILVHHKESQ